MEMLFVIDAEVKKICVLQFLSRFLDSTENFVMSYRKGSVNPIL